MTLCHFLGAKVRRFERKTTDNTYILIEIIYHSYLFANAHPYQLTI